MCCYCNAFRAFVIYFRVVMSFVNRPKKTQAVGIFCATLQLTLVSTASTRLSRSVIFSWLSMYPSISALSLLVTSFSILMLILTTSCLTSATSCLTSATSCFSSAISCRIGPSFSSIIRPIAFNSSLSNSTTSRCQYMAPILCCQDVGASATDRAARRAQVMPAMPAPHDIRVYFIVGYTENCPSELSVPDQAEYRFP